jgi:hypothetical protein
MEINGQLHALTFLSQKRKSLETLSTVLIFLILGFHGSDYEECRLTGCYTVWL